MERLQALKLQHMQKFIDGLRYASVFNRGVYSAAWTLIQNCKWALTVKFQMNSQITWDTIKQVHNPLKWQKFDYCFQDQYPIFWHLQRSKSGLLSSWPFDSTGSHKSIHLLHLLALLKYRFLPNEIYNLVSKIYAH